MKILKPGKVEQRRFVCPKCGCEFVEARSRMYRGGSRVTTIPECPCGWQMKWDNGEPYEEPPQGKKNVKERLCELLTYLVLNSDSVNVIAEAEFLLRNISNL